MDCQKKSLTPDDLEAVVTGELYIIPREMDAPFKDSTLTICILRLKNGYEVVGKAACVCPANFDAEIGRKIARQDAINQLWALEGYLLKEKLCG